MYGSDYQNRIDVQQICDFFRMGAESFNLKDGMPKDRHLKYSKAFYMGMQIFRDRVLAFDWETVEDGNRRDMKTEDMFVEALEASGDLSELAYEMGFRAGLIIGRQLFEGTD